VPHQHPASTPPSPPFPCHPQASGLGGGVYGGVRAELDALRAQLDQAREQLRLGGAQAAELAAAGERLQREKASLAAELAGLRQDLVGSEPGALAGGPQGRSAGCWLGCGCQQRAPAAGLRLLGRRWVAAGRGGGRADRPRCVPSQAWRAARPCSMPRPWSGCSRRSASATRRRSAARRCRGRRAARGAMRSCRRSSCRRRCGLGLGLGPLRAPALAAAERPSEPGPDSPP
jgi:hypothetical protein